MSTNRKRLSTKTKSVAVADANSDHVNDPHLEFEAKGPSKKRRKPSTGQRKASSAVPVIGRNPKGRGKLRFLPEMPLDILFDIFALLSPLDVLRLAQTTKALRSVLMRRSAISIWKESFARDADIPPCPEDLTLPQYANLAFSEHCHYCLKSRANKIMWAFRVRCCDKCLHQNFLEYHTIRKKFPQSAIIDNIPLLCRKQLSNQLFYSKKEVINVDTRLKELRDQEEELREYVSQRLTMVDRTTKEDLAGQSWEITHREKTLRAIEGVREERREKIFKRLGDLGWAEEVDKLNETDPEILSEHPLIKPPKELTDRMWQNMLPTLVELMEETREKRLKKQRKSILKKRQRILLTALQDYIITRSVNEINPGAADICHLDQFKAILEDTPIDIEVTLETFSHLLEDLPQLCEKWREDKSKFLSSLLPSSEKERVDTIRPLELATTLFKCYACTEPISYPRILAHSCTTALQHGYRNREDEVSILFINVDSEPWNFEGHRVSHHPQAEAAAVHVVRRCGLDPQVATGKDMDEVDRWLECVLCRDRVKGRMVFRWKKAILHDMYHSVSDGKQAMWVRLNEQDIKLAKEYEAATLLSHYDASDDFCCKRCRHRDALLAMKGHVLYMHGVQEAQEDDYYLHVDASMDQPPFPVTIRVPKDPLYIDLSVEEESNDVEMDEKDIEYNEIADDPQPEAGAVEYIVVEDD